MKDFGKLEVLIVFFLLMYIVIFFCLNTSHMSFKKSQPSFSCWLDLPQKRDVKISVVLTSKINIESK